DMDKVTSIYGDTAYKAAEIDRRNKELSELGQEVDRLEKLASIGELNNARIQLAEQPVNRPSFGGGGAASPNAQPKQFPPHHLKQMLLGDRNYKSFRDGLLRSVTIDLPDADFKTLVTLSTINRQNQRLAAISMMPLEDRTVADLMLEGNTDANTFEYYEETTF